MKVGDLVQILEPALPGMPVLARGLIIDTPPRQRPMQTHVLVFWESGHDSWVNIGEYELEVINEGR